MNHSGVLIIPDQRRIEMTFSSYENGVEGLALGADLLNLARIEGIEGLVKLSFDNSEAGNIKLGLLAPENYLVLFIEHLSKMESDFVVVPNEVDIFNRNSREKE